jgi:hypothetical protein
MRQCACGWIEKCGVWGEEVLKFVEDLKQIVRVLCSF